MKAVPLACSLLAVSLSFVACSEDEGGGSPAAGGQAGAGGSATGGSATGGSATGGSATGGSATGGSATGGSATGGSSSGGTGAGGSGAVDSCGNAADQLFPPDADWNTPVDSRPLDSESSAIINYLQTNHSSAGTVFQIDFGFEVLTADSATPRQTFNQTGDFFSPDCDPAPPPVPPGGALESESDYRCTTDGDCHLIVIEKDECRLYEMWRADIQGSTFNGGCQAIWDLKTTPPDTGRGQYCTSADAAGLPIAPMLFTADEIHAGEIPHALRFILPNNRIRDDIFVAPGTHSTGATSGPSDAPPYAARLRLKASTDISGFNAAAQVVLRALMKYGMYMADGGNVTFTARGDRSTTHKYDDVGLGPHDLKGLNWSDFEVPELGPRIKWSDGDCQRTPITQ